MEKIKLSDILNSGCTLEAFQLSLEEEHQKKLIEDTLKRQIEIIERQQKSYLYDCRPINPFGYL